MEQIKKFTGEFFRNLKCDVSFDGDVLVVENVSKSFEDLYGKVSPYRLSFSGNEEGLEFVGKGSAILVAMTKFLEGAGKASLLKIEFEVNPEEEVKRRVGLRNCVLTSMTKRQRNSFFSRFSFVTSFNYLNESERVLNEIYVYRGEVVDGDLSGYKVVEGDVLAVDNKKVKEDYDVAKGKLVELSREKQEEVGGVLKEKIDVEIERIKTHYNSVLKEIGGNLNGKLEKIKSLEVEMRSCEEGEVDGLKKRLDRLREGLVKAGNDEAMERVLKERELTIQDAMQKFSLNIRRKLMNTTVIYYSVYDFKVNLKSEVGEGAGGLVDVLFDPLTRSFVGLNCNVCGKVLGSVSLCSNGHISCGDCLSKCGECGSVFCLNCLKRGCKVCGRKLCRGCVKICLGCGGSVCSGHFRVDCVTGEERCDSCLRACLRCRGLSKEKYFGEALDGSKVCGKCLGMEKSGKVLERVFRR